MRPASHSFAVGAFLIGGLVLFTAGLFMIGDRRLLFEDSFEVYAEFSKLSGLQNGATVRVAGMNAGEVTSIVFPPGPQEKFRVHMRIREDLHPIVRSNSVALIQTEGLLGNKILEISAGTADEPPAPSGGAIRSEEPFDFADVMARMSETAGKVDAGVEALKTDLADAFERLQNTADTADRHLEAIGSNLTAITDSGKTLSENLNVIVENARAGKGSLGKLLTDEELYEHAKKFTSEAAGVTESLHGTSDEAQQLLSRLNESQILPEAERTLQNLRQISGRLNEAMEGAEGEGQGSMLADLHETLRDARDAMSALAENAEALKRSFFFRGYFKDRGFYNLNALTYEEYREAEFAKKRRRERIWLHASELFAGGADGGARLTKKGQERLDEAMAELLRYPPNSPLIVEGYASHERRDKQYLRSIERASEVRRYLVSRFRLDGSYVGTIPMGAVASSGPQGEPWDGVSLVLFYDPAAVLAAQTAQAR